MEGGSCGSNMTVGFNDTYTKAYYIHMHPRVELSHTGSHLHMPMNHQCTSAGAKESLASGEADLECDDMAVPLMLPPAVDRSSRTA